MKNYIGMEKKFKKNRISNIIKHSVVSVILVFLGVLGYFSSPELFAINDFPSLFWLTVLCFVSMIIILVFIIRENYQSWKEGRLNLLKKSISSYKKKIEECEKEIKEINEN